MDDEDGQDGVFMIGPFFLKNISDIRVGHPQVNVYR
jgi:hypothetical protein